MLQKQNIQIGTKKLNNQTFLEKRKINHKKKVDVNSSIREMKNSMVRILVKSIRIKRELVNRRIGIF